MDVRCEQCRAEYQLDENRIPPAGASVRCSACGHVFRVSKPGAGAEPQAPARAAREWRLRRADGTVTPFKETAILQRWIVEGVVTRDDELSPDGVTWRKLGDVPQLSPSFARADERRVALPQEQPAPPSEAAAPVLKGAEDVRRTLLFAGGAEWDAPPVAPPSTSAPPAEGWAPPGSSAQEEDASPMEQTGRQFPPPAVKTPPPDEGVTRVYDTSQLPSFAMPPAEAAGTQPAEERGWPPAWGAEVEPSAGEEGAAPWEESAERAEPHEEKALEPTEPVPAQRSARPWVLALGAVALVGAGAFVLLRFWPEEPPPPRPAAPRAGGPAAGARALGSAPAQAAADVGTAGSHLAAASGKEAAVEAGRAPAVPDAGVAAAPPTKDAGAMEPAKALKSPEVAAAPAGSVAPLVGGSAKDREMFDRWLSFGDRRMKRGESRIALRAYDRAAALDPSSPKPHVRRGEALLRLSNAKGALTEFREALQRDARDGAALFGLAEAYRALRNTPEARKAYERYLQVLPEGPQAGEARAALGALKPKQ